MTNIKLCEKTVDFIINYCQDRIKQLNELEKETKEPHRKKTNLVRILENQSIIIDLQLLIIQQNEKTY